MRTLLIADFGPKVEMSPILPMHNDKMVKISGKNASRSTKFIRMRSENRKKIILVLSNHPLFNHLLNFSNSGMTTYSNLVTKTANINKNLQFISLDSANGDTSKNAKKNYRLNMFFQTYTTRRPPKGPKMPFLSLVTLTFDLRPRYSNSSERRTKHVFPVNLTQIRSSVPDIFHTQTKKSQTAPKQSLTQFTACGNE